MPRRPNAPGCQSGASRWQRAPARAPVPTPHRARAPAAARARRARWRARRPREDAAADVSGPQAPPVEVPNTSASGARSIGAYFLSSPSRTGSTSTVQSALKCRCSTARYPSKQAELATEEALLHGRPERQRHGDPTHSRIASEMQQSSARVKPAIFRSWAPQPRMTAAGAAAHARSATVRGRARSGSMSSAWPAPHGRKPAAR